MEAGLGFEEFIKSDVMLEIMPSQHCLLGIVLYQPLIFLKTKLNKMR
jgi:hypothetical protein